MKKNLLFAISITLLFCTCKTEHVKNDWEKDGLKGNVKTTRETTFLAETDLGEAAPGRAIGAAIRIEYNRDGNKEKETWSDFIEGISKFIYKYDDKKRCIEEINYNPDDELESRCVYTYDRNGFLTEECGFKADGKLDWRWTFSYNKQGNLIERLDYGPNNKLEERNTYKYNEKGLCIEDCNYSNDGFYWKQMYAYDSNGKKTEEAWYNTEKGFCWRWFYTYDNNGNVTAADCYGDDGNLVEKWAYNYTYDKTGNWITKTTYEGTAAEAKVITHRHIEYFD